jgi:hypothetical protein
MVRVLLLVSESICCRGTRQEYQNMLEMDPSGKARLSHRHLGADFIGNDQVVFRGHRPRLSAAYQSRWLRYENPD